MNFSEIGSVVQSMIHRIWSRSSQNFQFLGIVAILVLGVSCERPRLAPKRPALDPSFLTADAKVTDVLTRLGIALPVSPPEKTDPDWISAGEELIRSGKAPHPESGTVGKRISSYFYCIDCHNPEREDSDLALISDPDAKLAYLVEHDLPLVPGSTFAGMVNRGSWYNGDYAKKYKLSLAVRTARDDLRKAIELCSRECSQGRDPDPWEMQAMMAYFWTLGWTLGDLGFTDADLSELKRRALNSEEHPAIGKEIQERYAVGAPATFGSLPDDPGSGYPLEQERDIEEGKFIWEKACLHCHGASGASEHFFGDKQSTWEQLARKFQSTSEKSIYGLLRIGTEPEEGKHPYMPNFTLERLSDTQIENLRAYIETMAVPNEGENEPAEPEADSLETEKSDESEPDIPGLPGGL